MVVVKGQQINMLEIRIYGLDTVVLRQSCIYGKYQNGTEDQGWVAWFIKRFIEGGNITIFGDGKQVRDILYIDDLIDLYELIVDKTKGGEIYNIGGGMGNTTSILEIMETLNEKIPKNNVVINYSDERDGDQKIFISSNKLIKELGWYPKVSIDSGIDKLITYLKEKYEDIDVLSVRKG
jgi:CDP-paratose 2-epimerase